MTPENIEERVMAIIVEETGFPRPKLSTATRIERDIGCTGDDAHDLLVRLKDEFDIDMSGFDFYRHFDGEGQNMPPVVHSMLAALCVGVLCAQLIGEWVDTNGVAILAACAFCANLYLTRNAPRDPFRGAEKKRVTVGHLVEAANKRKWVCE